MDFLKYNFLFFDVVDDMFQHKILVYLTWHVDTADRCHTACKANVLTATPAAGAGLI